ncbi:protein of unknown function [Burkholderia multivorans]
MRLTRKNGHQAVRQENRTSISTENPEIGLELFWNRYQTMAEKKAGHPEASAKKDSGQIRGPQPEPERSSSMSHCDVRTPNTPLGCGINSSSIYL